MTVLLPGCAVGLGGAANGEQVRNRGTLASKSRVSPYVQETKKNAGRAGRRASRGAWSQALGGGGRAMQGSRDADVADKQEEYITVAVIWWTTP